ncbi:hypothetical protein RHGRI_020955 [Rhododendron griersonianum]|uniref:Plant heme peroxidase family profile domain-containing protein n=1 Tax=Rhododendron griersonianum TaxID=479676 RepID=A0AAV6JLB6_9ERIC|nr:hypothetical protein RHGRI_020955 [Rhododendron griersonianum]
MMTATGVSSATSLSSATTNRRISKIRAKSRPTHPCGSKPIEALSSVATAAVENGSKSASFGRRGMLSVTTIPFFLNLHESLAGFHADAAEPFRDYFLVKEEVKKVLSKGKAAGVLRLVFHDAGTFEIEDNAGGMNGSIILGKAKAEVDMMIQPVSWADMIAVAGAEAVSVCGGPNIPVQLGRIDSMVPDPEGKLPQESLDASGLKRCFQRKGFS